MSAKPIIQILIVLGLVTQLAASAADAPLKKARKKEYVDEALKTAAQPKFGELKNTATLVRFTYVAERLALVFLIEKTDEEQVLMVIRLQRENETGQWIAERPSTKTPIPIKDVKYILGFLEDKATWLPQTDVEEVLYTYGVPTLWALDSKRPAKAVLVQRLEENTEQSKRNSEVPERATLIKIVQKFASCASPEQIRNDEKVFFTNLRSNP